MSGLILFKEGMAEMKNGKQGDEAGNSAERIRYERFGLCQTDRRMLWLAEVVL